jgi:Glycine zipper 2TM domain
MRLKIALLAASTALTILPSLMPASAQAYRGDCGNTRANNQAAGAVLGAVLGGVLGSNVSARGHRGDGTAVGAVVGALAGSEIGRSASDCRSAYGYNEPPYPPPPPAYGGYDGLQGGLGYSQNGYHDDYRYSGDGSGYAGGYDMSHADRLAARDRREYIVREDVGRECSNAKQITRFPDGSEIRRPVKACRDTYYGDWTIGD